LIEVYEKASLEDKTKLASTTSSFVGEKLKEVEQDLDNIEKKLQVINPQKERWI
jgi:phage shock protein A